MSKSEWLELKTKTEEIFKHRSVDKNCSGFQIQKNTCWNEGIGLEEVHAIEALFGSQFPNDYVKMLQVMNGHNIPQISIDWDGVTPDEFERRCYKYPDDFEKTKWLISDVTQYIQCANEVLSHAGFDPKQIEGFVPLYGHRALVVFKNKSLSPVLSIWGDDIILYGETLQKYWYNEFLRE